MVHYPTVIISLNFKKGQLGLTTNTSNILHGKIKLRNWIKFLIFHWVFCLSQGVVAVYVSRSKFNSAQFGKEKAKGIDS